MQGAPEGTRSGFFHSDRAALVALFFISCSNLIFEIAVTKYLGYKLFHHMTFAILGVAILSLGAAGVVTYLRPAALGFKSDNPWKIATIYALIYGLTVGLATPAISLYPINPPTNTNALAVVFVLIMVPFFVSGVCISQTLTSCKQPVAIVYFWDLLAAAIGAALCPVLLPAVGGSGTMAIAAALGTASGAFYLINAATRMSLLECAAFCGNLVAIALCLAYPSWAQRLIGTDIITSKEVASWVSVKQFGGIEYTHWNAIARVDVSKTGTSRAGVFTYGLGPKSEKETIYGRVIVLDGGANTRQFKLDGPVSNAQYLGEALWGCPYIARPDCKNGLVFGGGGGIDVLVGKFFKIPNLTVVEINPAVTNILKGKLDDPKSEYAKSLVSDPQTSVSVINDEARHFASTQPSGKYDTIQASGVDTLTAIQTGGMSLVENYLYTVEAVRDYVRILKPDGVLSLTHWRTSEPATSFRMFANYLAFLDSIGVKEPYKHIVVVGSAKNAWTDSMLSMTPFSPETLTRIRAWAAESGHTMVFDPERNSPDFKSPFACEVFYNKLGFAAPSEREQIFSQNPDLPRPVRDDRPYFYAIHKPTNDKFAGANAVRSDLMVLIVAMISGLVLLFVPFIKLRGKPEFKPALVSALYFSLCGFAFLLFETSIIQVLNVFVGGPTYSLAVVLVSVLFGYAVGSWIATRLTVSSKFFAFMGILMAALFVSYYFAIPVIVSQFLYLSLPARLSVAALLTFVAAAVIGTVVASAMTVVRSRLGDIVAWMWGISSIANAIGSISFVAITQVTGISSCLLVVAGCYCAANFLFGTVIKAAKS